MLNPWINACLIFNILKELPSLRDSISRDRKRLISGSLSLGSFGDSPGRFNSKERNAFWNDSLNVLPIDITSPTDCIWTPNLPEADGNFSKSNRGILVTI